MNILALLRTRFEPALKSRIAEPGPLLEMIRATQDAKFGDYQANFAMSLGKQLGKPPREVAADVAQQTPLDDLCHPPEIAGPGFINLRLRDEWLTERLQAAVTDERLGVTPVAKPRTYVIDYSSPNVAKPMHVGHIRSTVIGDALDRTLRFLGHKVISDNHLGDWGTQFGMVIYGYKHFVDAAAFAANPVAELSRLYRFVHRLVDYRESLAALPAAKQRIAEREAAIARQEAAPKGGDKAAEKKANQALSKLRTQLAEDVEALNGLEKRIAGVEADPELAAVVAQHADIDRAVLAETAKLHAGDAENLRLWNQFLPHCRDEIQRVYKRLNIKFDYEYGESFYHDMLGGVVEELNRRGLARESDGALCVFLEGFETPMIVQKKDGAFLYSTTDLATIQYRAKQWQPEVVLYVVDHRQGEHFEKLFAAAKRLGFEGTDFRHVSFGTILGEDGRPYKTRSGDTVGLEGLLDEAVSRALKIVADNDDGKPDGAELSAEERQNVAEVVGIGGLKYIDLMQNRTTDYIFSYDKMLATTGNTATYMQYSYARVRSIFRKAGTTPETVRASGAKLQLTQPAERALGLMLLRFGEALEDVVADYRPNLLTSYLFDLAKTYFTFYEACPVLKAETPELRASRLLFCDLTARTIALGLSLLGIQVVEKM
jgi:arginyl-tRNA synthetase